MINNLNKKRERDDKEITITLGKLPKGYYYIGDSCNDSIKIKIPIGGLSKEDNPSYNKNKALKSSSQNKKEKEHLIKAEQIMQDSLPEISEHCDNSTINYSMPTSASWFNINSINDIEVEAFPEFFNGKYPSKTPEIYKEYRNFMVNLYRENQSSYLTATVCRRHLAGDAYSIMRIHGFLDHWGIINFKVDPINKPTNPFLPKAFNFKPPIYVDASTFLIKEGSNSSSKIGNNNVILTNKSGEELRTLYPINTHPEVMFRSFYSKNPKTALNQVNLLTKNYRPKCDLCDSLCGLDWYISKKLDGKNPFDFNENDNQKQIPSILTNSKEDKILLICEECYEKGEFPNGLDENSFELSNVFNILMPNEKLTMKLQSKLEKDQWSIEETKKLLEAIDKYDDKWDEIAKVFEGKRTKADCIIHLMQLPIKENVSFKVTDLNMTNTDIKKPKDELSAVTDQNNPLIGQIVFFAKMFEKYVDDDKKKADEENKTANKGEIVGIDSSNTNISNMDDVSSIDRLKENIYKTYSQNIDVGKNLQSEEKNEMKKIMNLIVHLQMKKIQMKLDYFDDYDKMIQLQNQQLKTMESQVIQDRIKLAIKKNELLSTAQKMKEQKTQMEIDTNENNTTNIVNNTNSTPNKAI